MLVKGRKKKSVNPGSPGEQHPLPPAIHSNLFLGPGWEPGRVLHVGSAKGYSRSASKRKGPKASVSVSSPPSSSGHFSPNLLVSHSSFFCLAFPFRFQSTVWATQSVEYNLTQIQHLVVHNHLVNPLRVCEYKQLICSLSAGIAYFMGSLQLSDPSLRKWE